jgi:hypothetical protein
MIGLNLNFLLLEFSSMMTGLPIAWHSMISEFNIKSYELTPWSNNAAPPLKPELSLTFYMIELEILTQLKEFADITCPSISDKMLLSR